MTKLRKLEYTIPNGYYYTKNGAIEYFHFKNTKLLLGKDNKNPYLMKVSLIENISLIQEILFCNSMLDACNYITENAEILETNDNIISEYQKEIINVLNNAKERICYQEIKVLKILNV